MKIFARCSAQEVQPGWNWHHGVHHLNDLQPGYTR